MGGLVLGMIAMNLVAGIMGMRLIAIGVVVAMMMVVAAIMLMLVAMMAFAMVNVHGRRFARRGWRMGCRKDRVAGIHAGAA